MTAYFKWEDEVFIFWFLSKTSISFSQLCELCEPLYVSLNTWVYSRFFPVDQVLIWFILPPPCHLITSRLPPLTPSVTPAGGHIVLSDTTCHVSSQQRRGNIKQSNQSINQSINLYLYRANSQQTSSHDTFQMQQVWTILLDSLMLEQEGDMQDGGIPWDLRFVCTCPGFWLDWKALV